MDNKVKLADTTKWNSERKDTSYDNIINNSESCSRNCV